MFKPGDTLSHALHGIGTLDSYDQREVGGTQTTFATLTFHRTRVEVSLPKSALEQRARALMDESSARGIVEMLTSPTEPADVLWKKRQKDNLERLKSGDPKEICAVAGSLTDLAQQRQLSSIDREQLRRSLEMLSEELCAVLGGDEEQTIARLQKACASRWLSQ